LQHLMERACILTAAPTLSASNLFEDDPLTELNLDVSETGLNKYLRTCERRHIINSLNLHQWQMSNTAVTLGISRKTLWDRIKKLGIRNEKLPPQDGESD
jgi:DNA-binding NtrC family response regulator